MSGTAKFVALTIVSTVMATGTFPGCTSRAPDEPARVARKSDSASTLAPSATSKTYVSKDNGISLQYPASWQPVPGYEGRFGGTDGFFQFTIETSDSIDHLAQSDAHQTLGPYGSKPEVRKIEKLAETVKDARVILPYTDQAAEMQGQAELLVKLPLPDEGPTTKTHEYLVLWADQSHILNIAKTIKFPNYNMGNPD
jgi:TolB protein